MHLIALLLLIVAALGLRGAAAVLRARDASWPVRLTGWALAGVAAWFAAGAAGAWAPLWPALLAGVAAGLIDRGRARHPVFRAGADAVLVAGLGLLSIPVLAPARIAAAGLLMAAAGLALDLAAGRLPAALHRPALRATAPAVLAAAGLLVLAIVPPIGEREPTGLFEAVSLDTGVMPAVMPGTQRLTLPTGAVAWLDRPPGNGTFPGALFFHGADADGARQASALAARRALLDAGFVVLAVDHPGYGASPHPEIDADVEAWDPLPTDLAAYEALAAVPGVRGITAVGHSMGNGDVLRLLTAGVPLEAAVMLGAGLDDPAVDTPEYWGKRFLSDRGIVEPMDLARVREIRRRYYENRRYALELPASHAPVRFVTFGIEWPNLTATRDELYRLLPGRKSVWHLPETTHYLDTKGEAGLIVGDTRATRELAARLRVLAGHPEAGDGEPDDDGTGGGRGGSAPATSERRGPWPAAGGLLPPPSSSPALHLRSAGSDGR